MKTLLGKLGTHTYILDLRNPCYVTPDTDGFNIRLTDPMTLESDVYKGQNVNDLFIQLSNQNIEICSIRSKSNRLEELFIHLLNNKEDPHGQ
jgi:ABC-2 type transport system ATP-binding protein